jgi:hypothetical protein
MIPTATPVIYRRHNCARAHRGYRTFAKCVWPRAVWIAGNGAFAVVAYCRAITITLHQDLDAARDALQTIDATGCGGRCSRHHKLVQLEPQ